jgi:hypothetical protein
VPAKQLKYWNIWKTGTGLIVRITGKLICNQ